jgi:hypothetical protein
VEAPACGVPCITGSYAGGAELLPYAATIDPVAFRYESVWSCKRPVYSPQDWAEKAEQWIGSSAILNPKYDWNNLWEHWETYLREAAI